MASNEQVERLCPSSSLGHQLQPNQWTKKKKKERKKERKEKKRKKRKRKRKEKKMRMKMKMIPQIEIGD